ncbi:DUF1573 domain-containing protein [Tellurirhabdus rosea]|uniref:DUF1573 domain-containing protein n=1 Tax=Tellurirhabdus rosea TaxID=2674997 RepID=UPI0022546990|nr:DUF1573 domain-containing protein [Tellurirhabdus rosea]
MKRILFSLMLLGTALTSCQTKSGEGQANAGTGSTGNMPKIVFADKGIHDFGTITEGQTVERDFKFKNEGTVPLIINNINVSCGCTTPEWPKKPVQPGEEAAIKVQFNSTGKLGEQNKTVTVYANTDPAYTELAFRAMVKAKNDTSAVNQ